MEKVRPGLELCWGTARGVGLPELIDIASAAGFESISVPPSMYFEARRDGFADDELRERLADAGVVVGSVDPLTSGLPGIPPLPEVSPQLRTFVAFDEDDCLSAAEGLGADTVNLAHFLGGPQPLELMADVIGAMSQRAGDRGIRLSMEFIPLTGIPDLATALDLVRRVGAPNLGVMFDTWHFFRSGGTVDGLADLPAGAVIGLQVNDATMDSLGSAYVPMIDRLVPGQGILPLVPLLGTLRAGNPELRIGVEVFQGGLRRLGAEQAAHVVASAIRPIVEQLG